MKRTIIKLVVPAIISCVVLSVPSCDNSDHSHMDRYISHLMKKMTLEEKIGQLNLPVTGEIVTGQAQNSDVAKKICAGEVGGLFNLKGVSRIRELQELAVEQSRMGIPLLFGMDVIHGYKTVFPIPLGLSCTWDMDAIETSARIAATEASADGICWTFSPMVDICRDPRWGRIAEGCGEDPFLGAAVAKAMVKGYQGRRMEDNREIMACVKHFALYGAPDAGRDYNTVDMSRQRMFNEYLMPYKAAVDAGAGSVMASFNEVDGIPATGNKWLMTEVLRKQWGFDGFVVSDYTGISEMIDHGMGDTTKVASLAINAGVDMDMVSEAYLSTLARSVREGKVSEKAIDRACRSILEAKYKLGLFADPYKYCSEERGERDIFTDENRRVARKIASECFVLLKNEGNVLPLERKGTIGIVGPLADSPANMAGTWSVAADLEKSVSLAEGIRSVAGDMVNVLTAKGCNLMSDPSYEVRATMFGRSLNRDGRSEDTLLKEALQIASESDVILAALGESSEMSGECSCRTDLTMPETQTRLLDALVDTGKPVVLVLFTGRPLVLTREHERVPAILNVWFGGTEAGLAIGDVLFGDVNPGGKLTTSFPKSTGQIPIHYNHKNTGRPLPDCAWFQKFRSNYLDVDNEPLYPFGYGLSYTTFQYGDIVLDKKTMDGTDEIQASIVVTNTGERDGHEVVQMYIRDLVGSVTRPVMELKGFEKVFLKAGESKTVYFRISPDLLRFYNYDLDYVYEPGDFSVMIGGNSRDLKKAVFTLL